MSTELLILTALVAALASLAIIRPAMLFEYPVATAALMGVYIIPQAWLIESSGDFNDYEPTRAWTYMILCVVLTFAGFRFGAGRRTGPISNSIQQFKADYDLGKLFVGACALAAIGGFAVIMIFYLLQGMEPNAPWTGAIAFYALLATLLYYSMVLSWIIYLYTKRTAALVLALVGFCVNMQAVLFSARREALFVLVASFLLGLFFVRGRTVSRIILLPSLFVGTIFVTQAGQIRGYMQSNNASIVSALSQKGIASGDDSLNTYHETASAVTDIAIATYSDRYVFLNPYLNQMVSLYVPAFILGRDAKDSLMSVESDDDTAAGERYFSMGATRTGFSDSFRALHFFGSLTFFAIAYFMGILWSRAKAGDVKGQIYYIILLSPGLKVMTESTSVFISVMPLLFCSLGGVLWYAGRSRNTSTAIKSSVPSF